MHRKARRFQCISEYQTTKEQAMRKKAQKTKLDTAKLGRSAKYLAVLFDIARSDALLPPLKKDGTVQIDARSAIIFLDSFRNGAILEVFVAKTKKKRPQDAANLRQNIEILLREGVLLNINKTS